MKRLFKSRIFFFILGVLVTITSTVFAYDIIASNIGYTPLASTFIKHNGDAITNTSEALDELYNKFNVYGDLIWFNNGITSISSLTIKADLSKYSKIVVAGRYTYGRPDWSCYVEIAKNSSGRLDCQYNPGDITKRTITVTDNTIEIGNGIAWDNSSNAGVSMPIYIFGVR